MELPLPSNDCALKGVLGNGYVCLLRYVDPYFSQKISALTQAYSFLLTTEPPQPLKTLKEDLLNARLQSIDENAPFMVECDTFDFASSAILSQNGRLVAFMLRTLACSESHYPAIKKEAASIIEAVQK